MEAWQAQRRKLQEEEETARVAAQQQAQDQAAATNAIKWSLEDEEGLSDEEHGANGAADGEINIDPSNGRVVVNGVEDMNVVVINGGPTSAIDEIIDSPPDPLLLKPGERQQEEEEEEEDALDAFMKKNAADVKETNAAGANAPKTVLHIPTGVKAAPQPIPTPMEDDEDEIDPLDAFMAANVMPEVEKLKKVTEAESGPRQSIPITSIPLRMNGRPPSAAAGGASQQPAKRRRRARYDSSSDDDYYGGSADEAGARSEEDDDIEWAKKVQAGKLSKGDRLGVADHSTINYPPFRRNFYIEVAELAKMSPAEVEAYRKSLDGIKVRGKDVPKPVKNWNQCGLSARVLETIRRSGFDTPLPIQAQALPVIMGGRDCIGIAKTGSGKTLAFVLPLIRHVKDQPPLASGDGPIGLIMAPTRELVTQIGKEVKRFARAAGIDCTCVYGGSGVANQISELKRGTEIVACTPGRMIDILATGNGKITNLRRVTYLVLDEADRMFDMGFEPQIMRIVNNIRPDRQTVLFSATFPRSVETLARKVLINPVEIQVGGRSVVNADITQYVEIRKEEDRFLRLLELLGEWYERGKVLIFVSSQDRCDGLFRDLLRAGYPCLSLHGGKDQSDRESTISDFKSAVCNVLVATSVAARGLDVKELVLVVNYDCPNHHEDYIHRVGRTGRAGAKGTAVTFISPDEEQYAPDLVKALKDSGARIPADLATLAQGFEAKRKAGLVKAHGSGFGGSGFKFNEAEDEMVKMLKKAAAKEFGIVEESESEEEEDGDIREVGNKRALVVPPSAGVNENGETPRDISTFSVEAQARIKTAQSIAEKLITAPVAPPTGLGLMGAGLGQPSMAPGTMPWMQQPTGLQRPQTGAAPSMGAGFSSAGPGAAAMLAAAQAAAQRLAMNAPGQQTAAVAPPIASGGPTVPSIAAAAAAALQAMGVTPAAALAAGVGGAQQPQQAKHYEAELEINDFPQQARWKVRLGGFGGVNVGYGGLELLADVIFDFRCFLAFYPI